VTTAVAFLRAVNLGRRRARAADLVAAARGLGYTDAWTYINSGNVVLEVSAPLPIREKELELTFEAALGFEATTFLRSRSELQKALHLQPFPVESGDTYFITFLKRRLDRQETADLEGLSNDFDTLVVADRDVHWRMRGRSSDSKLRNKQWADIVGPNRSTSRNTTMLRKLLAAIDDRAG
jgi:uncharacterized protein (DUF1697 family)